MPRVDFYILADGDEQRRIQYLCRLVDKAYRLGHRVWIRTPVPTHAAVLDERLWTFSQGSFVPHQRAGGEGERACPVVIGEQPGDGDERHLLINEGSEVPAFGDLFDRIAEVVNQDPETRAAGRARYARYRDAAYDLHHHQVEP